MIERSSSFNKYGFAAVFRSSGNDNSVMFMFFFKLGDCCYLCPLYPRCPLLVHPISSEESARVATRRIQQGVCALSDQAPQTPPSHCRLPVAISAITSSSASYSRISRRPAFKETASLSSPSRPIQTQAITAVCLRDMPSGKAACRRTPEQPGSSRGNVFEENGREENEQRTHANRWEIRPKKILIPSSFQVEQILLPVYLQSRHAFKKKSLCSTGPKNRTQTHCSFTKLWEWGHEC